VTTTTVKPHATIQQVTPLYSGFMRVNRYRFEVTRFAGDGTYLCERELLERGNAVAVLGFDRARREVVLISEFRPGLLASGDYPFTGNLVAGGVAEGESAIEAAIREMVEETGLTLHAPLVVHPGAYVSSGGTSEKIAIVAGEVDTSRAGGVHGNAAESEDILTVVMSVDEFIRRVRNAQITDMKTLIAGYWFADFVESW
jgi:ADP-ribose pyrophosphatase